MPFSPISADAHPSRHHSRRRLRAAALVAVGVTALHVICWQGVKDSFAGVPAERAGPPVQVRTLPWPEPKAMAVQSDELAVPQPAPRPRKPAPVEPPNKNKPVEPMVVEAVEATPPLAEPEVIVAAALPAQVAPMAAAAAAAGALPDSVPVYRTKMPPATTLNYTMRQGGLSGMGVLRWRHTDKSYDARLEGKVFGFNILTWASEGAIDSAGIAPTRFTDQRRNKAALAANFQRGAGKITYSGSAVQFPLLKGTQDRLSWMLQIAAIAEAEPQRLVPGAKVAMFVSGARGDADVWTFQVQGASEVEIGDGPVKTIKLLREPRKPHDTKVEVWLAPSLHHLPVRARLSSEGSSLELLLQSSQAAS